MVPKPARRTTAQDLTYALQESLPQLGGEFRPNQLAYLSLTSKNELPLCGALAWLLHKKFAHDPKLIIRREYRSKELPKRPFDIAVLRDSKAIMLIEAKAAMAFDLLAKGSRIYPSKDVLADADKLKEVKEAKRRYTLTFFTLYDQVPPNEKDHAAITYIRGMKLKSRQNAKERFEQEGLPRFRNAVDCRCPVAYGEIPAGDAFGVKVSVWYELIAVSD